MQIWRYFVVCWSAAVSAAAAGETDFAEPYVRLFDARRALDMARPIPLAGARTWRLIPAERKDHAFAGDVIALNDRVALLASPKTGAVRVAAVTKDALAPRAAVEFEPAGGRVESVRIEENSPAACTLELRFAGASSPRVRLRVTAGQPYVAVEPLAGLRGVRVVLQPRFLIVPDFFGEDLAYPAGVALKSPTRLPTENMLLGLLDDGRSLAFCVWPDRRARVTARPAAGGACAVEFAGPFGRALWIALLEGPRLWRAAALDPKAAGPVAVDWTPPFEAKWRADFLGAGPVAQSAALASGPGAACCVQGGQTRVRAPARHPFWGRPVEASQVVFYPIDRTRATPLTEFCLTDIVRDTLGSGPCKYVLELEGIDAEASPTPTYATQWIERQFRHRRGGRVRGQMEERLRAMQRHLDEVESRLRAYAALARCVREALRRAGLASSPAGEDLLALCGVIERTAKERSAGAWRTRVQELSNQLLALCGQRDARKRCKPLCAALRDAEAEQNRAIARCRLAARLMRVQAEALAAGDKRWAAVLRALAAQQQN